MKIAVETIYSDKKVLKTFFLVKEEE